MNRFSFSLIKYFTALCVLFACSTSCKKNVDANVDNSINNTVPDLSTKINSSVSGFVTDENNTAVLGATVYFGNASLTTDQYGYFKFTNVETVKMAATVMVKQPGYFNAIKTWAVTENRAAFFRIKLLPKTIAGTINSNSGGNVTLPGGSVIALPSNGVVVASNNTAYTGDINVAAVWIDPEANNLDQIMPGDLRAINKDGYLKGLTTFGMTAVELTNTNGELLQIANGKKATITLPLSSNTAAAAPSTIPLWYFDEGVGLWKEEGTATKSGATYTGEVSHFSWWNCDLPNATVPLTFTLVDPSGNPLANTHVEITPTSTNSWSHIGGYTDATGYVSVFVTANAQFLMQVVNECNALAYTINFNSETIPISLGNLAIDAQHYSTISGHVTDCNNQPVTNGYLLVQKGNAFTNIDLDNNGNYDFSSLWCSGSGNIAIVAIDNSTSQQSTAQNVALNAGTNTINDIQSCGTALNAYIICNIDGVVTTYTEPTDSLYYYPWGTVSYIYAIARPAPIPPVYHVGFSMDNPGIGIGSSQNMLGFIHESISEQLYYSPGININFTEFGPVGGFVAGNFSGAIGGASSGHVYQVSYSFRVRRNP